MDTPNQDAQTLLLMRLTQDKDQINYSNLKEDGDLCRGGLAEYPGCKKEGKGDEYEEDQACTLLPANPQADNEGPSPHHPKHFEGHSSGSHNSVLTVGEQHQDEAPTTSEREARLQEELQQYKIRERQMKRELEKYKSQASLACSQTNNITTTSSMEVIEVFDEPPPDPAPPPVLATAPIPVPHSEPATATVTLPASGTSNENTSTPALTSLAKESMAAGGALQTPEPTSDPTVSSPTTEQSVTSLNPPVSGPSDGNDQSLASTRAPASAPAPATATAPTSTPTPGPASAQAPTPEPTAVLEERTAAQVTLLMPGPSDDDRPACPLLPETFSQPPHVGVAANASASALLTTPPPLANLLAAVSSESAFYAETYNQPPVGLVADGSNNQACHSTVDMLTRSLVVAPLVAPNSSRNLEQATFVNSTPPQSLPLPSMLLSHGSSSSNVLLPSAAGVLEAEGRERLASLAHAAARAELISAALPFHLSQASLAHSELFLRLEPTQTTFRNLAPRKEVHPPTGLVAQPDAPEQKQQESIGHREKMGGEGSSCGGPDPVPSCLEMSNSCDQATSSGSLPQKPLAEGVEEGTALASTSASSPPLLAQIAAAPVTTGVVAPVEPPPWSGPPVPLLSSLRHGSSGGWEAIPGQASQPCPSSSSTLMANNLLMVATAALDHERQRTSAQKAGKNDVGKKISADARKKGHEKHKHPLKSAAELKAEADLKRRHKLKNVSKGLSVSDAASVKPPAPPPPQPVPIRVEDDSDEEGSGDGRTGTAKRRGVDSEGWVPPSQRPAGSMTCARAEPLRCLIRWQGRVRRRAAAQLARKREERARQRQEWECRRQVRQKLAEMVAQIALRSEIIEVGSDSDSPQSSYKWSTDEEADKEKEKNSTTSSGLLEKQKEADGAVPSEVILKSEDIESQIAPLMSWDPSSTKLFRTSNTLHARRFLKPAIRTCKMQGCRGPRIYAFEGQPATMCEAHRARYMQPLRSVMCNAAGCLYWRSYGFEGQDAWFCEHHRLIGMEKVFQRRCEIKGCKSWKPLKEDGSERSLFCHNHQHLAVTLQESPKDYYDPYSIQPEQESGNEEDNEEETEDEDEDLSDSDSSQAHSVQGDKRSRHYSLSIDLPYPDEYFSESFMDHGGFSSATFNFSDGKAKKDMPFSHETDDRCQQHACNRYATHGFSVPIYCSAHSLNGMNQWVNRPVEELTHGEESTAQVPVYVPPEVKISDIHSRANSMDELHDLVHAAIDIETETRIPSPLRSNSFPEMSPGFAPSVAPVSPDFANICAASPSITEEKEEPLVLPPAIIVNKCEPEESKESESLNHVPPAKGSGGGKRISLKGNRSRSCTIEDDLHPVPPLMRSHGRKRGRPKKSRKRKRGRPRKDSHTAHGDLEKEDRPLSWEERFASDLQNSFRRRTRRQVQLEKSISNATQPEQEDQNLMTSSHPKERSGDETAQEQHSRKRPRISKAKDGAERSSENSVDKPLMPEQKDDCSDISLKKNVTEEAEASLPRIQSQVPSGKQKKIKRTSDKDQPTEPAKEWTCGMCTLLNSVNAEFCSVCFIPRDLNTKPRRQKVNRASSPLPADSQVEIRPVRRSERKRVTVFEHLNEETLVHSDAENTEQKTKPESQTGTHSTDEDNVAVSKLSLRRKAGMKKGENKKSKGEEVLNQTIRRTKKGRAADYTGTTNRPLRPRVQATSNLETTSQGALSKHTVTLDLQSSDSTVSEGNESSAFTPSDEEILEKQVPLEVPEKRKRGRPRGPTRLLPPAVMERRRPPPAPSLGGRFPPRVRTHGGGMKLARAQISTNMRRGKRSHDKQKARSTRSSDEEKRPVPPRFKGKSKGSKKSQDNSLPECRSKTCNEIATCGFSSPIYCRSHHLNGMRAWDMESVRQFWNKSKEKEGAGQTRAPEKSSQSVANPNDEDECLQAALQLPPDWYSLTLADDEHFASSSSGAPHDQQILFEAHEDLFAGLEEEEEAVKETPKHGDETSEQISSTTSEADSHSLASDQVSAESPVPPQATLGSDPERGTEMESESKKKVPSMEQPSANSQPPTPNQQHLAVQQEGFDAKTTPHRKASPEEPIDLTEEVSEVSNKPMKGKPHPQSSSHSQIEVAWRKKRPKVPQINSPVPTDAHVITIVDDPKPLPINKSSRKMESAERGAVGQTSRKEDKNCRHEGCSSMALYGFSKPVIYCKKHRLKGMKMFCISI